ncbi:MAG: bifunctional precorrin-2 dehydrogenase/sirohydrochlorin ferrochelatase [Planctomycetes bacterium]|jgi:siroheme synthase-like protein|nr:bifunctional precorrin-2 dehydrogenase/sirohydrochlorin ferrochelatase [Planctomycetota bacterium]MCL4729868.1 bifunctional precorrin-2 dehydrogenase/sirohydrochlorin ferrochelatase [Planctomycetota bacterium]
MYPIFLRLEKRPVLVVGAGTVAARKIEALLAAGAEVYVIAPGVCPEVAALAARGKVTLEQRPFRRNDCDGAFLVIAATGDSAVNRAVRDEAERLGLLVNSVDDPANCNFYVPALVRVGDLRIAVSTQGKAPMLSGLVRAWLQRVVPAELAALVEDTEKLRLRLKQSEPDSARRNAALRAFLEHELPARKLLQPPAENP